MRYKLWVKLKDGRTLSGTYSREAAVARREWVLSMIDRVEDWGMAPEGRRHGSPQRT